MHGIIAGQKRGREGGGGGGEGEGQEAAKKGIVPKDAGLSISMENPIAIGIIGGGQLGKMIAQEAKRMSLKVVVLDPIYDCPASFVSDDVIVADFKDESAIRKLAAMSDILTYEIELANSTTLKELELENYP